MNKNIRNIIITAVISLFIGFEIGGISQTGRCPLTGHVVCKERAAACCKKEAAECPAESKACSEESKDCSSEATEAAAPATTETAK